MKHNIGNTLYVRIMIRKLKIYLSFIWNFCTNHRNLLIIKIYYCRNYHPKHLQTLNLNLSKSLYLAVSPSLAVSLYLAALFILLEDRLASHVRWAFLPCMHTHILSLTHTRRQTNAATLCVADTRRLLHY